MWVRKGGGGPREEVVGQQMEVVGQREGRVSREQQWDNKGGGRTVERVVGKQR